MQKFKTAFFDLIRGDKTTLIVLITQITVGFLFAISLLLPYMVSNNLIDGSLSSSDFPGGGLYTFIFFMSILGFAYFAIMKQDKYLKMLFIGQAVLATIIFFYSLLFHKVGLASASNGFGKVLEFLLIIVFWFLVFGEKYLLQLIHKFVPETVAKEAPVEVQINPETPSTEPKKSYIPKSVDMHPKVEETKIESPKEEPKIESQETPKTEEEPS